MIRLISFGRRPEPAAKRGYPLPLDRRLGRAELIDAAADDFNRLAENLPLNLLDLRGIHNRLNAQPVLRRGHQIARIHGTDQTTHGFGILGLLERNPRPFEDSAELRIADLFSTMR